MGCASGTLPLLLLLAVLAADAFYLPGLTPTNFCRKEVKNTLSEADKNKCKVTCHHHLLMLFHVKCVCVCVCVFSV